MVLILESTQIKVRTSEKNMNCDICRSKEMSLTNLTPRSFHPCEPAPGQNVVEVKNVLLIFCNKRYPN